MLRSLEPCAAEHREQGLLQQVFLCFDCPNILSQHPARVTVIVTVCIGCIHFFCVCIFAKIFPSVLSVPAIVFMAV